MKKYLFILPLGILLLSACSSYQKPYEMTEATPMTAVMTQEEAVERGKYLTMIMGCHDCHTPKTFGEHGHPMFDMTRMFSGHPADDPYPEWTPADMERNAMALVSPMMTAWGGPWGVSFTTNLTPDDSTGLGEWTEESFIAAIRTGKHQGQPNGRAILPLMPWEVIREATDEDLKAIWAYLESIPPIENAVPTPVPPAMPPKMEE
ncbi:MAG: diheme cytochrome c-553 [Candidatus Marinimicrobia bacterium]|nr:diheme cytochrome c-553 [Candidatus Neomarinimicrobiota bacterium]